MQEIPNSHGKEEKRICKKKSRSVTARKLRATPTNPETEGKK